jgi:hypothetical protein
MIELSVIRDLVAIFGVIAGFSYYVLTVRATRKNQDLQLETRKTQLFMQMYNQVNSQEFWRTWAEIMTLEVSDYDDFLEKFDHSINPDNFGKRANLWFSYNVLGNLLYDGKLEVQEVNRLAGITSILQWEKWKDVIIELREKQDMSNYMTGFEYMVTQIKQYRKEHPNFYT